MREQRQSLKQPTDPTATKSQPPDGDGWLTTRQAYDLLQPDIEWPTFRKLSVEAFRSRFNIEADPGRKIRGKTDVRWLRLL